MWEYVSAFWADLLCAGNYVASHPAIATMTVWFLGALLLVWQVGKQARNAILQSRETEKQKLKLQVYEKFAPLCATASDAKGALFNFVQRYTLDLKSAQAVYRDLKAIVGLSASPSELLKLKREMGDSAIDLIGFIERWAIIDLRMNIFKVALNAALADVSTTFAPYFDAAIRTMQFGSDWTPPDESVTDALELLADSAADALLTLGSYLYDFQAEMQNLLLGELFSHTVPPRLPLDTRHIVVTLDRHDELTALFAQRQH